MKRREEPRSPQGTVRELSLFPFYVRQRVRSLEPECLHFLPKDTACNCSTLGKLLKLQSLS